MAFHAWLLSRSFARVSRPVPALSPSAEAGPLTGRVLDPAGRPVPGATVLVDGPLGVRTTTTDAEGRFTFDDLADASYRVLVEAPGFAAPARTVRTGADTAPIDLQLHVAPYSEAVVVAAAPVPRPRSESPASTTVVGPEDVKARQLENVADALRTTPGLCRGPQRRPRRADVGLPARRRVGLHAGAGRRHPRQQLRRRLRLQPAAAGRRRAGRDRPRPAKRGLRRRRDRRRRAPDDPAGRTADRVGADRRRRTGDAAGAWARLAARSASGRLAPAASATRATASPASRRPPARRSPTTTGSSRWPRDTWSGPGARRRRCAPTYGGSTPSAATPGPYGSNPIGAYTAVDRVSRGEDTQQQLGLHGRLPWGSVLAGRIQQRWQVTVADLDNRYHSSFGDSFFETRRVSARTQTDVVLTPTTGLTAGVEGFGERARSTYITGEQFQEVPIERRTFGGFAEVRQDLGARASVSAGLRADAIRRNALEGDPNPFGAAAGLRRRVGDLGEPAPGRTLRRVAGRARRRADDGARQLRHRHQASGRLRDCVHRQPGPEARTQPQRGHRRQPRRCCRR